MNDLPWTTFSPVRKVSSADWNDWLRSFTLPAIFSCNVAFCIEATPIKVNNSKKIRHTTSAMPFWEKNEAFMAPYSSRLRREATTL
ncbi:hypothetical protein D9M73_254870 [compost metagenome]